MRKPNEHRAWFCNALEIAEIDYNMHQFNEGMSYLYNFFGGETDAADLWAQTATFWKWWINQWDARNQRIHSEYTKPIHGLCQTLKTRYYEVHSYTQINEFPGNGVAKIINREVKGQLTLIQLIK